MAVIAFRMLHAMTASTARPPGVLARRPSPMIVLYRKKVFSTGTGRLVEGDCVVGRIRGDSRDVVGHGLDQLDACRRVIDRRVRERMSDDHTGWIDTQMEFLPPARAPASMFRRRPFTLADDRQARAVDDELKAGAPGNAPQRKVEVLAATGQRRVIWRP